MRRTLTVYGIALAALAFLAEGVEAQRPQTRDGFYIGFGIGGGSFGCSDCQDRESGPAGTLKLGGTVSPSLLVGADISAWTKEEGGARVTHSTVVAAVQFYPSETGGFFLKGGIGVSRLEASASSGGLSFSASDDGLGLSAGLGYDIRLGSNFSLSPYGSYGWGDFEGGSANHVQLGLGVTWH